MTTDRPGLVDRKRGRPTEAERAERKEQILDAAMERFMRDGYASTSVEQIAADCRVTKRTIYTYFGDKTEVFAAAIRRLHARAVDQPAPGSRPETLTGLAIRIVQSVQSAEAIALHRLVIAEAPRFPELASTFYTVGPAHYIDLLASALAGRGTRSQARARAESLFTLLLGEAHRKRLLGLLDPPSPAQARAHARHVLAQLDLSD